MDRITCSRTLYSLCALILSKIRSTVIKNKIEANRRKGGEKNSHPHTQSDIGSNSLRFESNSEHWCLREMSREWGFVRFTRAAGRRQSYATSSLGHSQPFWLTAMRKWNAPNLFTFPMFDFRVPASRGTPNGCVAHFTPSPTQGRSGATSPAAGQPHVYRNSANDNGSAQGESEPSALS